MVVADVFRAVVMANCFIGLICLIPFKGITRIHPMLWFAMVLFGFYDITNLISQPMLWNTPFTIRNVFSLVLSTGALYWAGLLMKVGSGRRVQMWPFKWYVKAHESPSEVWRGQTLVYRQGIFNMEGLDDQGETGQAPTE